MYDQETDIRLYLLSERTVIMKTVDNRKVAIIGCGFVGSSSAFALMQSGLFSEIALVDVDRNRAEGEALDISHGVPFVGQVKVYASDYDGIMDAGIPPGQPRSRVKPGWIWSTRMSAFIKALFRKLPNAIIRESFSLFPIRWIF